MLRAWDIFAVYVLEIVIGEICCHGSDSLWSYNQAIVAHHSPVVLCSLGDGRSQLVDLCALSFEVIDVNHDAFPDPAQPGFKHVIAMINRLIDLQDDIKIADILQREEIDIRDEGFRNAIT